MADKSVDWYEKIVSGDPIFTYCFLGALADNTEPLNHYVAAIIRNPDMAHEPSVKDYFHSLLDKYRNGFKCGKLFFDATFRFLLPDQIALMEAIAGLPINGCLDSDEFYSFDRRGVILGERALGRNPHICHAVSAILNNFDVAESTMESAANSANVAWEENEKYLDSIQGRLAQLDASFQVLSTDILSSGLVKSGVSFLTSIVKLLDKIINLTGALPAGLGIAAFATQLGKPKMTGFMIVPSNTPGGDTEQVLRMYFIISLRSMREYLVKPTNMVA